MNIIIIVIASILVVLIVYFFSIRPAKSNLGYEYHEKGAKLSAKGTTRTPSVLCDKSKGTIELRGRSMPENSYEFYRPLEKWVDEYILAPQPTTQMTIELQYFNTGSSQCLVSLFKKMEQIHKDNEGVVINWIYEDEDMLTSGRDLESIINVPFKFFEVQYTN